MCFTGILPLRLRITLLLISNSLAQCILSKAFLTKLKSALSPVLPPVILYLSGFSRNIKKLRKFLKK